MVSGIVITRRTLKLELVGCQTLAGCFERRGEIRECLRPVNLPVTPARHPDVKD